MTWAARGSPADPACVVGGAALLRAAAAAAAGQTGEVIVGAAAVARLPAVARLAHDAAVARLLALDLPPPAPPAAPAPAPAELLPRILRRGIAAQREWLAEFRRVSVLFAAFGDADFAAPAGLAQAQASFGALQALVAHYDGIVYQLVADGPGATLIAGWGLPSVSHEDDARRAVEAALAIERELGARGIEAAIGVASGRVFCGLRGSALRRDFAIMGDRVNLAARLMRAAGRGVLCDDATALAAAQRIAFERLTPIRVKGKAQPVAVSRPLPAAAAVTTRRETALVGRGSELAQLERCLDAHAQRRGGAVLIVEGEAGIGKSTLLAEAERLAAARGWRRLRGDADAIESATAYYVWRAVLRQLFAGADDGAPALRERVLAALADTPALLPQAPLLNDLLPLELPESELSAQMEPQGRADALRDLVANLVERHAGGAPLLLVLDDAHWFDSASWAMCAALSRRSRALLLLGTRPIAEPRPPALQQLRAGGAATLALAPLGRDAVLSLACRRLGVEALPPPAAALIGDKAQGNPFFGEQLALALRDAGLLHIEDGRCRLAEGHRGLDALAVPDTVQGVVTGRIDRLQGGEQLTLKVASVIGRVFAYALLHDVYPAAGERTALRGFLQHLTQIDLTRLDRPEPELQHLFTHVITQQVAYELMSFAQRRALHRAVAGWIEQRHGSDLSPHLQLLAWHWDNADDAARALSYLERAAAQALGRFANEEVLRFVEQAETLARRGGIEVEPRRRARWEAHVGEALLKLARYSASRGHFEAALHHLGRPLPRGRAGLALALAAAALRQAWRRVRGTPARHDAPGDGSEREAALQAVHLHQRLAEVGYWQHDALSMLHGAVVSLNLAEPAGVSRQLQLAHQVLAYVAGLAGSAALFHSYRRRAAALAAQVDHVETTAFCAQLEAIYFNGQARWAEMEAAAERGGALFQRIGERFRWQTCIVLRAWGRLHQGDVGAARALFDEAAQLVRAEGPTQVQLWCAAGALAVELAQTQRAQASSIEALEQLLAQGVDHSDAILCRGLLAKAHLADGARAPALAHADAAAALIRKLPPASFHTLLGNVAVVELRLREWQLDATAAHRAAAREALRGLRWLAWACPIARPALWRAHAAAARLEGRPRRALRCDERACREAARLGVGVG